MDSTSAPTGKGTVTNDGKRNGKLVGCVFIKIQESSNHFNVSSKVLFLLYNYNISSYEKFTIIKPFSVPCCDLQLSCTCAPEMLKRTSLYMSKSQEKYSRV